LIFSDAEYTEHVLVSKLSGNTDAYSSGVFATSSSNTTYTATTGVDGTAWDISGVAVGMTVSTSDGKSGTVTVVNDGTDTITVGAWTGGTPANGSVMTIRLTIATNNTSNWHLGKAGTITSFAALGDSLERKPGSFARLRDFTVAGGSALTWTQGTLTLSHATSAVFETYTWQHLDRIYITGGTGMSAPVQVIVTGKTSDYAITVATDIGATDGATNVSAALTYQEKPPDAYLDWPGLDTGWLEFSMSGILSGNTNITDTTYAWDEATRTLTKAGDFASYTWAAGDRMYISAGSGAIPGWYLVSSRTSDDAIVLQTTIGGAAAANITGRLYTAETLIFRLYRADPSGANPTNLLQNPTSITVSDIAVITSALTHFEITIRLRPIQPEAGTTDTQSYSVFFDMKYATASATSPGESRALTHCYVARGTTSLARPSMFYMTYQKSASSSTFDIFPRSLTVTHKIPRIT
jgi:hypothetical protein